MRTGAILMALGTVLTGAMPTKAQTEDPIAPLRGSANGAILIANPTGEFGDYVGTGFGLGGSFTLDLVPDGVIGLRAGGGFINYGHETKRVCFSQTVGCRIEVDLTTTNNIFFGDIGPELASPTGRIRPYVNAGIGFAYFATTSTLEDISGFDDDIASTTNFDDITFAWRAGAGLRIRLVEGRVPIHLDFGADYHGNGGVEYLTEGGIIDHPDGSIEIDPIFSDANLFVFSIGGSVGIRW